MTFLFWLLFFSISFLSVFTSLISKNGESIQILLAPLLCVLLYFVSQNKQTEKVFLSLHKKNTKQFLFLILGSILIWLLNAIPIFNIYELTSDFPFRIPSKDSVFYGRLSERLLISDYESYFAFHNDTPAVLGTSPYHFFELWLSAFFSKIFSISGFLAYSLITLPLLQICVWIGFLATYEQVNHKKTSFITFVWALGLLFLCGVYFPFYYNIKGFQATYWLTNTIFTGLSEHYFFWIAAFLCFQQKKYRASVWVIFMIPIVSLTLWAACWTGLFSIGIVLFYQNKTAFLKKYKVEITSFFLLPIGYLLFYYLTQSSQSVANTDVSFLALSTSKMGLFGVIKEITIYLFGFFVIYIPFLILLFRVLKPSFILPSFRFLQTKSVVRIYPQIILLLFFMGGILGGIIFYLLLPFHSERFQFLRNFILPFIQISLIYFFIIKQNYLNVKVKVAFIVLLLYGFGFTLHWFWKEIYLQQEHSQIYLNEIGKQKKLERGAVWYEKQDYATRLSFNRVESYEIEGEYLAFKTGIKRIYNLNLACIEPESKIYFMPIQTDVFAVWLHENNPESENICNDSLKWIFIEEHNLDFLILGKNVHIPTNIQTKIKFKVKDNLSGEVFLRLK